VSKDGRCIYIAQLRPHKVFKVSNHVEKMELTGLFIGYSCEKMNIKLIFEL